MAAKYNPIMTRVHVHDEAGMGVYEPLGNTANQIKGFDTQKGKEERKIKKRK